MIFRHRPMLIRPDELRRPFWGRRHDPGLRERDKKLAELHKKLYIATNLKRKQDIRDLTKQIKRLGQTGEYGF